MANLRLRPVSIFKRKARGELIEGVIQRHAVTLTTLKEFGEKNSGPDTQYHVVIDGTPYHSTGETLRASYLATARAGDMLSIIVNSDGSIKDVVSIEYREQDKKITMVQMLSWLKKLVLFDSQ